MTNKNLSAALLHASWQRLESGELAQAEHGFRQLLNNAELQPEALHGLGMIALHSRQFSQAIEMLLEVSKQIPGNAGLLLNIAIACHGAGNWQKAIDYAADSLRINNNQAHAYYVLADACRRSGQHDRAIKNFQRAIDMQPVFSQARLGLALVSKQQGNVKQAMIQLESILQSDPSNTAALNNLGNLYSEQHLWQQAASSYSKVIKIQPGFVDSYVNLAIVLEQAGNIKQAEQVYLDALTLRPDSWPKFDNSIPIDEVAPLFRKARMNLLSLQLRHGCFSDAWQQFDYRLTEPGNLFHSYSLDGELWRAQDLSGKTIYLMREQGLGDEICYASYLPELLQMARHCIVECHPKLELIFRESFPDATIIPVDPDDRHWPQRLAERNLPEYDYFSPLPSTGIYLRPNRAAFQPRAYLKVMQWRIDAWKEKINQSGRRLSVGVSWRGGKQATQGEARSMAIEHLLPLLNNSQVQLVNLQYGDTAAELAKIKFEYGIDVLHWQAAIDDYAETAALVSALDLVITVDTSLAHLAGALGQRVWCMVPEFADWRWQDQGSDTLWYPQMRLYRQQQRGHWSAVIETISVDLGELVGVHSCLT